MKDTAGKQPNAAQTYVPLSDALRNDAAGALRSGTDANDGAGLSRRLLQYANEAEILERFRDETLSSALASINNERLARQRARRGK